ncbi:MAG TPA: hypothetical protein VGP52_05110 [Stellaceae bacterium]|nr:hypothetical protein [Stellaceae bacterium]
MPSAPMRRRLGARPPFQVAGAKERVAIEERGEDCRSSIFENRVNRFTEFLKKARDIAREAPAEIPTEDELEEMEEADRERGEHVPEAITLAGNPEQVRDESGELERLGGLAQAVEEIVREVRLAKLHSLLESAMRE